MHIQPHLEVQDIFHRFGESFRNEYGDSMSRQQHRVMHAIKICRTADLGGHAEKCDSCAKVRISYNSCRNRHCPKCQFLRKEKWLEERNKDILPISYFHVVFTIPNILNPLTLRNQKILYDILFRSSAEALQQLAGDEKHLGANIGFTGVLHTWGQNLMEHPHVHYIVTGGGLSDNGKQWLTSKKSFFLPVRMLSRLFRGKFLFYLSQRYVKGELIFPGAISELQNPEFFKKFISKLYRKEWVVYLKSSFKNSNSVFEYLSRYTHRIAISNARLIKIENETVFFKWRDYSDSGKNKEMGLHAHEFIRRFLLHCLPNKYVRIRHFGMFSNRYRSQSLKKARLILGLPEVSGAISTLSWKERLLKITGINIDQCPFCGKGKMEMIRHMLPAHCNSPPWVCV
jgi:hypothetical protein